MKTYSLLLAIPLILSACVPAAPAAGTASPSRPAPSASPAPTKRTSPLPAPSLTATPGVSPLLPLLEAKCFTDYPAAIELPTGQPADYRLKTWSVDSAFELIRTIDENSPPCADYWTGAEPVYSLQNARRRAAQLAVQEATLRYPEDPNRYLLDWRFALNHVLIGESSSDEWLVDQIRQVLKDGRTTPEGLGDYLHRYSFEIVQMERANNLFGDGETGYVYWLSAYQGRGNGMYFAVRADADGKYSLYPLLSSWDVNMGTAGGFTVEEHTKDGIPEVMVMRGFRNGSFAWDILNIFQWNEDKFQDLTVQGVGSSEGDGDTRFDKPDARGFDTLHTLTVRFPGAHTNTYEWNGSFYEPVDESPVRPAESNEDIPTEISMLNEQGKFAEAEKGVRRALANFSDLRLTPDLNYSFHDYLQFQLGWVKALQMDEAGAKEIFQSLRSSPTEAGNTIVSRAAQDFLKNYTTTQDLYRACQAANQRMSEQTDVTLCDLPTALTVLSKGWTAEQYSVPIEALAEYGAPKTSAARLDVDGDGAQDWVLAVEKTWPAPVDLYVVRLAGAQSSLAYLGEDVSPAFQEIRAVRLPGDERPTLFLQSGRTFSLYQIVPGIHQLNVYHGDDFSYVRKVEFSADAQGAFEFKVSYFPDDYLPNWETYRWDPLFRRFLMVDEERSAGQAAWEGPVTAAQHAEAKLLVEGKPEQAILAIKQVVAMPRADEEPDCWMPGNCYDRSRLLYLLALSYELTGDEAQAVQVYWQLWHDDPGSAYAVLARAKLELAR